MDTSLLFLFFILHKYLLCLHNFTSFLLKKTIHTVQASSTIKHDFAEERLQKKTHINGVSTDLSLDDLRAAQGVSLAIQRGCMSLGNDGISIDSYPT